MLLEEEPETKPLTSDPAIEADPTAYTNECDNDQFKRSFALNYALRQKPKCLFAMAMGFPEFQGILDRPPLSTIKRKELNEAYIPKADDFKHEIKRRSHFMMNSPEEATFYIDELKRSHPLKTKRSSIVLPQPNQWLNTQLKQWLIEKPLKPNDNDTRFIRFQIKKALEYLASEGSDGAPEVLRDMPFEPTPVDGPIDGPVANSAKGGNISAPVKAAIIAAPAASNITPDPEDIDTKDYVYSTTADSDEYKLSAAETFISRGGKPRVLFTLAVGIPELQKMVESATFSLVKRKEVTEDYVPRAEDFRYEIKRRAHIFMNMEEQQNYYTQELKTKHPLENMRGVVSMPQPNQWKLQALKAWLVERPLKPNQTDIDFLKSAIKKCMDALSEAVSKDPTLSQAALGKRPSTLLMTGGDLLGTSGLVGGPSLMEVIAKQDAILSAVSRQSKQQTILNKITILTQSNMGYQQEISSLRSTLNDIENRIMTIEMKIAETPSTEANLKKLITKQEERKKEVESKIEALEEQIASVKEKIDGHNQELQDLEAASAAEEEEEVAEDDDDDDEEAPASKKAKVEEEVESVTV